MNAEHAGPAPGGHAPEPRRLTVAEARDLRHGFVVLDVREAASFAAGHLPASGHLPRADFESRQHELPPPGTTILIVAADGEAAERAAHALPPAFRDVAWLEAPIEGLRDLGWETGPPLRLWRPARFLEEVLPGLPRGRAIDLACGAGREAVFLALNGFEVEAWDHDPAALERAADLAVRSSVRITTVQRDFEGPAPDLPRGDCQLVTCFRYLHRPLFPAIEHALAPGGHLVYETYRAGQEQFGRPRRARFLLEPGELSRAFPGLAILRTEEPSPPGGPWTSRLHAHRLQALVSRKAAPGG